MVDEPGVFARIPLTDVRLSEAVELVDDPSFFDDTRMVVLHHFSQVSLDDYWDLTVGDHRAMVDYLIGLGLYGSA